jgi:hypothetical protein
MNRILDDGAPKHAAQWGCVWNRDIRALVESSGLRVVSLSTYHFGTTYYVVATPSEGAQLTLKESRGAVGAAKASNEDFSSPLPRYAPEDQRLNADADNHGAGQEMKGAASAIAAALSAMVPVCVPWLRCSCGRCGCR